MNGYYKYSAVSIVIMAILILAPSLSAQSILTNMDHEEGTPVQYSLLPLAGYTSDIGLFGGALFQRINYGQPPESPFLSRIQMDLIGSFKGELQGQAVYEHTKALNGTFRSRLSMSVFRSEISHFFGIGNQASYSEELYNEDYFFFRNRNVSFRWRLRKMIAEYGFNGTFEVFTDLRSAYFQTASLDENSSFADFQLSDDELSGWTNTLGLGIIADDRDSEFNPTEGYRYEAGVSVSDPFIASEYSFTSVWGELRNYVELFPNVVLAHKLRGEVISGNPPFWELSTLGNQNGLRGYHMDRFRGNRSIINIFELRTWLFSVLDGQIRFGGQLFWDSGRVFTDNDSAGLFNNWRHTLGTGGAISLFSPDFIVTGDLGFSEDTFRIYAGIGYNF